MTRFLEVDQVYLGHWAFPASGPVSCPSTTEACISWFRFASGAVHVCVDRIGPPGFVVVSSSASPAKRAGSAYVHWYGHIVHATGCVGGIEAIWILLIIERSIWVALEVPLEVRECAATESTRLELWAWNVGRIAALLL